MGAWEIRQRLGYGEGARKHVQNIISRRSFPAPYQTLKMGSGWDERDVEAWIAENRPELDGTDPEQA